MPTTTFFLPIYVNNRRMHVLKLRKEAPADNIAPHSFLLNTQNTTAVFSLPAQLIQLIADDCEKHNVELTDGYSFHLQKDRHSPYAKKYTDADFFCVEIKKGKSSLPNDPNSSDNKGLLFQGEMGDDQDPLCLMLDYTRYKGKHFVLRFAYEEYSSSIHFFAYKDQSEIVSATLDFGSEASQVRFKGKNTNENLVDLMCDLTNMDKSSTYWQSSDNPKEKHFKSVYFIKKNPAVTTYGELPMSNGPDSFVQTLLASNTEAAKYADLQLLPNLKLIELLNYDFEADEVNFPAKSNVVNSHKSSLNAEELQQGILRLIISNFLATVIHSKQGEKDFFLEFIMMVPNVYYQAKIGKIVADLYSDFELILQKHTNLRCLGLEVKVVSESDASFFGFQKANPTLLSNREGSYSLIVDAGKGTTDFSVLRQGRNYSSYDSTYRYGIPASGHVLTYAFYEALRDYFTDNGLDLNDILSKADQSRLQEFVRRLEKCKENSATFKNEPSEKPKSANIIDLNNVNTYLDTIIKEKAAIPYAKERLDAKITQLLKLIEYSIIQYSLEHHIQYLNVILTGRAFRLDCFRKRFIDLLISNNLVERPDDVKWNDATAKTVCTDGALYLDTLCTVNKNSGLIGNPSLGEKKKRRKNTFFNRILEKLIALWPFHKMNSRDIDFAFFYEGLRLNNAINPMLSISGRYIPIMYQGDNTSWCIYFVGDGFICHYGEDGATPINEASCKYESILAEKSQNSNDFDVNQVTSMLVKQSLFPFKAESLTEKAVIAEPESPTGESAAPDNEISSPKQDPTPKDNNDIDMDVDSEDWSQLPDTEEDMDR